MSSELRRAAAGEPNAHQQAELRGRIRNLFYVPDGAANETERLIETVEHVAAFVRNSPCRCTAEMKRDDNPCDRCTILGL